MSETLQKKLRLTPGTTIVALNAPAGYARTLGRLPKGAAIVHKLGKAHAFIHLFVANKAQLEREIVKACAALAADGLIWISYPKGAKTDLTRDKGWEGLEKLNMQWLALISFDDDWSAFLMKNAPPKEQSKASKEYQAAQITWVDAATKTVRVPDDLATLFKKSAKAKAAFEALTYTNRKEYVLWIVGAKQEATRTARLSATIDKLLAGKKNPSEK